MRELVRWITFLGLIAGTAALLPADSGCAGILTDHQQKGFAALFTPPYSASLTFLGGAVREANLAKSLTDADIKRLSVKTPVVAKTATLTEQQADDLKGWLNENASATVPGWVSTTIGVVVPQAWVGLTADVFIQLMNGAGDAGRQKVANLAGTVSPGGAVGVTEQVAPDRSGTRKFIWAYIYQANLNGKLLTSPLAICSADIKVTGQ